MTITVDGKNKNMNEYRYKKALEYLNNSNIHVSSKEKRYNMHSTLETILNKLEPVQLYSTDIPTDIDTAVHVFNQYMQLILGQYYKIELLSNHYSCLYRNNGRSCIGLVPNKEVITLAQEIVKKCNNF